MKIFFVVGSLSGGGAERVVAELAQEMADMNAEVYVLLTSENKNTYLFSEKVNIVDCSKRFGIPGVSFVRRVGVIRKEIMNRKPDVCISFTVGINVYSIFSCLGLSTKLIVAERNDPRFDPTNKLLRILRTALYPLADNYVFQTQGEKDFFSKRIQNKSIVIHNPINRELPQPYHGERDKRFVTAVRLAPQKNIKMAIDAFQDISKDYSEYKFEIYGQGPLKEELATYIKEKGIEDKAFLMGATNTLYIDIQTAYGFLLSSDYEGMSNSMLEAMGMGIPVISTDYPSGGAREVICHKVNGFLVPVNDYKKMAFCMRELISDNCRAKEISKNAEKIRKELAADVICKKWIEYILSIVNIPMEET